VTITTELVAFFILVFGAVSGIWWRVEGKVKGAEDKAEKVGAELAAHRIHTAEVYVTKAGLSEQTSQIMKALDSVGAKIDRTNERLDNLMQPKPRSTRV
jgi:predicted  nucleic acid-binding Zn-ribbon protein